MFSCSIPFACRSGEGLERVCVFVQMEAMEKKSLHLCVTFLEQIAKMTGNVVLEICAEQYNLNDKVQTPFLLWR